jgi:hypothetical protein
LRNRDRNNQARGEEENEEADEEEEQGRDRQSRRVNNDEFNDYFAEEDSDEDGLEVPREDDEAEAAAANNRGRGGENRAGGDPQGPVAAAANNQGRGERNRAAPAQGPAAAAVNNNQGGVVVAAVNPSNCMETAFRPYVDNRLQEYESPFNDTAKENAMRSAGAHVISLQHLVDNPDEERQPKEYMVCIILAIVNSGTAQTRGRTTGRYNGPQQSMPYQRMLRCMCINSDSGRNAFTMFHGEGVGGRMFHASMEQRDNGTFSENLCVCF